MDDIKKLLVATIDTVDKEVTIDTVDKKGKSKQNVVEEAITSHISAKKNIDTINKTEKSQASKRTVPISKKLNPQVVRTVDKSGSTQRTNLSNISTRL